VNKQQKFNDNILFVDHLYKTIDCEANYKKPIIYRKESKESTKIQNRATKTLSLDYNTGWSGETKEKNTLDISKMKLANITFKIISGGIGSMTNGTRLYASIDILPNYSGETFSCSAVNAYKTASGTYVELLVNVTGNFYFDKGQDGVYTVSVKNLAITGVSGSPSASLKFEVVSDQSSAMILSVDYVVGDITETKTKRCEITFEQLVEKLLNLGTISAQEFMTDIGSQITYGD
jgi:hypothetical protein